MKTDLFSVPIFLICFREVLEAAIILSVLLALIEQIVKPYEPPQQSEGGEGGGGGKGDDRTPKDRLSIQTPRLPPLQHDLNQSHLELQSLTSYIAPNPPTNNQHVYRAKIVKRMRLQVLLPPLIFGIAFFTADPIPVSRSSQVLLSVCSFPCALAQHFWPFITPSLPTCMAMRRSFGVSH